MELSREHVRERVRRLLGDRSDDPAITGEHDGRAVTFSYSELDPPQTHVRVDLPATYELELALRYDEARRSDTSTFHGFAGTASPAAVASYLLDRTTCDRLIDARVASIRFRTFSLTEHLSRRVVRMIEQLPQAQREPYRSRRQLSLNIHGWIEDPDRAVAAIVLAVELASRLGDAFTRAAVGDGSVPAGTPYRDAPAAVGRPRPTGAPSRKLGYRALIIIVALIAGSLALLRTL